MMEGKQGFQTRMLFYLSLLSTCLGATQLQCRGPTDCPPNEYCEQQRGQYTHTCQCVTGYVRVNGNCLPERDKGQLCVVDTQCSHLKLVCYRSRCSCPGGHQRVNGSCVDLRNQPSAPTPPVHLQSIWDASKDAKRQPKRTPRSDNESYSGPIAICALIFVSFSVLIVVTSYNFRMRNRRLEEVRAILDAHATNAASAPHARRASIGSIRDAPPSYNTLSPPSYEQATGQSVTPVSARRNLSYSLSIETAPMLASNPSTSGSVRCNISYDDRNSHEINEEDQTTRDRY